MPERLHKLLAAAGVGSRREIEDWIRDGRITVNGVTATVGQSVELRDRVAIDKRPFRFKLEAKSGKPRPPRVLLYNKPEGEIVSRDDPQGRPTVFAQLPRLRGAKWIAVGRLDVNTGGLLLFTTSGDLANRLMHPRYEVEREYAVRVMGELSKAQAQQLLQGIEMEDGLGKFEHIEDRGGEGSNHWYHVVLKEGRNREVRRIFQAVNLMVSRLIRVRYGAINLPPRIKRGQMLELEPAQVQTLLKIVNITESTVEAEEPVVAKRTARGAAPREISSKSQRAPREESGKSQRAPREAKREPGAKPQRTTRPASAGRAQKKR